MRNFKRLPGIVGGILRQMGETGLGLLYPPHCAACGRDVPPESHLCDTCATKARRIIPPFCRGCSEQFIGSISGEFLCADCQERQSQFTCSVSAYRAVGIVREFILRFKYDRHYYLRHQLAEWLSEGLRDERLGNPMPELLVPVPLHPTREREREFNQAQVLADLISGNHRLPVARALIRTRYTKTQTQLNREDRLENLRGAFCLRPSANVRNRHLILIDDVFTTGSTVQECARVLNQGGAASVRVLTVARAINHL